jgi:hypothetical protein
MPMSSERLPEKHFTKTRKLPGHSRTIRRHFQINRNNLEPSFHVIKARKQVQRQEKANM